MKDFADRIELTAYLEFKDATDEQKRRWYPIEKDDPSDGVFEIGLVMAGAVSAGAYTAGVMDFLFEALDAWAAAKQSGDGDIPKEKIPDHLVQLKIITGASAGGINGAIAASALPYKFPPIIDDNAAVKFGSQNPFYSTWVNNVDITDLLKTDDLDGNNPLLSGLDCDHLVGVAGSVVQYSFPQTVDKISRDWVSGGLPVVLMGTNLPGVPYRIDFQSWGTASPNGSYQAQRPGYMMSMHADQFAFVAPTPDENAAVSSADLPPHYLRLANKAGVKQNPGSHDTWASLAQAALATAAFPFALSAREYSRNPTDYQFMHVASDVDSSGNLRYIGASSLWPLDKTYSFVSIDGGATNNEPFDIAHDYLCGISGKNSRDGEHSRRAVLMIDPFCEPDEQSVDFSTNLEKQRQSGGRLSRYLLDTATRYLFAAQKNQSRFKMRDLLLAIHEDVYSRFLISPTREHPTYPNDKDRVVYGSRALASGSLSAFMGFFSRAYRHHDYLLGRRNCQQFLREHLVIHKENQLIKNQLASGKHIDASSDKDYYPIIPLFGSAKTDCPVPEWPAKKFSYGTVKDAVHDRVNAVVKSFSRSGASGVKWYLWPVVGVAGLLASPVLFFVYKKLINAIDEQIDSAIEDVDNRFISKL
ncbi:MAG TPA: patatin-like phospholipase family protein [Pseudomonadales bacterium]|nr:patatin-like phospholipase family protein [Pseudomonadales bacterium]